jgi:hypothetical protein
VQRTATLTLSGHAEQAKGVAVMLPYLLAFFNWLLIGVDDFLIMSTIFVQNELNPGVMD